VSSILVNKIFAYQFGTAGIALLAHLQNLLGIITLVPKEGVQRGLVKYLAEHKQPEMQQQVLLAARIWNLLILLIAGIFLAFNYTNLASRFAADVDSGWWLLVFWVASGLHMLFLTGLALLLVQQQTKKYALVAGLSGLGLVAAVVAGVFTQNLSIALLSFAIGHGLSWVVLSAVSGVGNIKLRSLGSVADWQPFRNLGKYCLLALFTLLSSRIVDFYVRQYALTSYGLYQTGLWQAVTKLSEMYTQLVIAVLEIVFFPLIAAQISNRRVITQYLRTALLLWVPLLSMGLGFVFLLKEELLLFLFDKQFVEASFLVKWQVMGDFFRLVSYFFAYLLLAQARIRVFIGLQIFSAVLYILTLVWVADQQMGIVTMPIAHIIRSIGYCGGLLFCCRRFLYLAN
jgi:O-antigen/teichoic acid export membrane protein